MPKMQSQVRDYGWQMAEALAEDLGAMPSERAARNRKGSRLKRIAEQAQEFAAVCGICLALILIFHEVLVIAG